MRISPELEWLRDYLPLAEDLVPIHKVKGIRGLTPPNNLRRQTCHAIISKFNDGTFSISLFKKAKSIDPKTREITFTPYSSIDLLMYLAHELARTLFFDKHCPSHKKLEAKILGRFMTKLKSSGYISEEHEQKNN